jgi:hypothetical protein
MASCAGMADLLVDENVGVLYLYTRIQDSLSSYFYTNPDDAFFVETFDFDAVHFISPV